MSHPSIPAPAPRQVVALGSLTATPLSDFEWRVSDDRLPANDGRSVVGFVTRTNGGYETVELADPVRFSIAPSLDAAMAKLAESAARRPGRVTCLSTHRTRNAAVSHAV